MIYFFMLFYELKNTFNKSGFNNASYYKNKRQELEENMFNFVS
jgi:hypothetical protein